MAHHETWTRQARRQATVGPDLGHAGEEWSPTRYRLICEGDYREMPPATGARSRALVTTPVSRRLLEALLVLTVPTLVLLLVGRQAWTPPNTPDSEFYLSLSAFGHEITDRALSPAYYWTRLGAIAPLRAMSSLFGPDVAYAIWRWILLTIAIVPSYVLARVRWGIPAAIAAAATVGTSTVLLTVTANPYPTGAVVPLLAGEVGLLALAVTSRPRWQIALSAGAGLLVGWIVMCNQIGGVYSALVFVPFAVVMLRRGLRGAAAAIAAAIEVAALTFVVFLWVGTLLFPALDWFETTRYWVNALDPSAFHAESLDWLRASPLLLAPVVAGVVAVLAGLRSPRHRVIMFGLAGAVAMAGAYAAFNQFVQQGSALETPVYAAFLWGPALACLATAVAWLVSDHGRASWAASIAVVVASCLVGRAWVAPFPLRPDGVALAVVMVGCAIVAIYGLPGAPRAVLAGIAAVVLAAGVQVLQNGTPVAGAFISLRVPYWSAYRDTGAAQQYASDLRAERWVLANTTPGSRVLVWAPRPELGGVAAMSLNGPNALSMSRDLAPGQVAWLRANAPVDVWLIDHTPREVAALARRLARAGATIDSTRCTTLPPAGPAPPAAMCLVHVSGVR